MTAFDSGSTMRARMRHSLAPSMRALSISSDGTLMKNARTTTRLNALIAVGRMSAHRLSFSPKPVTTR